MMLQRSQIIHPRTLPSGLKFYIGGSITAVRMENLCDTCASTSDVPSSCVNVACRRVILNCEAGNWWHQFGVTADAEGIIWRVRQERGWITVPQPDYVQLAYYIDVSLQQY